MAKELGRMIFCFNLIHNVDVIYSLYIELVDAIDSAKKWDMYFYDVNREFKILKKIYEKEIK